MCSIKLQVIELARLEWSCIVSGLSLLAQTPDYQHHLQHQCQYQEHIFNLRGGEGGIFASWKNLIILRPSIDHH